jgi:hypothetical protein
VSERERREGEGGVMMEREEREGVGGEEKEDLKQQ